MSIRAGTRNPQLLPPGRYEVDAARSTVGFDVRHLMIARVRGSFHAIAAEVSAESDGPVSVTAEIDVASIDTGDPKRDERMRAPDFFDAEHHPKMTFSGRATQPQAGGGSVVRGTMTIRGVSRPLELLAEPAASSNGNGELRVRASGQLSRSDFGLEWDSAFAAGGLVIDDRVALRLDIAFAPTPEGGS